MSGKYTIHNASLEQFPATIIDIFNLSVPYNIPPPILEVSAQFKSHGINAVILIVVDNLDLFQVTLNKPEAIIQNSDALVLLNTNNGYTQAVLNKLLFADSKDSGFHLIRHLNLNNKSSIYIAKPDEVEKFAGNTPNVVQKNDTDVWVEATKHINKFDFIFMHFDGFDVLTNQRITKDRKERAALLEKLMKRTDQWINNIVQRIKPKTLVMVMGTKGIKQIDIEYPEDVSKLESGTVPCVFMINKK